MKTVQPGQAGNLGFLDQYKAESEIFSLPSGAQISIAKIFLKLKKWEGVPIPDTYNNKAVIDWQGEPVFAELAVFRLFQANGWDGVWVDSYRRKYRIGLPGLVDPVDLLSPQAELIRKLRGRTGRSGGCWDLLLWNGDFVVFCELKRKLKDQIRNTQIDWLAAGLDAGLTRRNFILAEWDFASVPKDEESAKVRPYYDNI